MGGGGGKCYEHAVATSTLLRLLQIVTIIKVILETQTRLLPIGFPVKLSH